MWTVTIEGKAYELDDLPPAMFVPIADRHMLSWLELRTTPASNPNAYYELIELVAKLLDVPVPARPTTMGQVVDLLDLIARTDGRLVDPRVGEPDDESETNDSSTGSPTDSDGPQQ